MNIPVLGYSADERETVILYDNETKLWNLYTNVPTHITKCMKQYSDYNIKIETVTPSGEPSCIRIDGVPNAITFRSPEKRKGGKGNPNLGKIMRNKSLDITE